MGTDRWQGVGLSQLPPLTPENRVLVQRLAAIRDRTWQGNANEAVAEAERLIDQARPPLPPAWTATFRAAIADRARWVRTPPGHASQAR